MKYDEFLGQVQHRARLASGGEAVRAIRATLETLSERLAGNEASHLAAQLPEEIAMFLRQKILNLNESFGLEEFIQRVSLREGVDPPKALFHARVVMEVLHEAVSRGEMEDVRQQLPEDYSILWEGSQGHVRQPPPGAREPAHRR